MQLLKPAFLLPLSTALCYRVCKPRPSSSCWRLCPKCRRRCTMLVLMSISILHPSKNEPIVSISIHVIATYVNHKISLITLTQVVGEHRSMNGHYTGRIHGGLRLVVYDYCRLCYKVSRTYHKCSLWSFDLAGRMAKRRKDMDGHEWDWEGTVERGGVFN